ncbi:hypothetical protein [Bradyrhizobium sp. ISRA463]|nr:hypothetical protein [Bradyrhizobium sp. ISRA463]WGS23212.1 hypothetical protein MTX22_17190 [Bradyrhizobium sp. ISRA463]
MQYRGGFSLARTSPAGSPRSIDGIRGNSAAIVIYEGMANGQVVLVTTEPLDGGPPVRSVFFVAEGDAAKATAIIAEMMAPNERVEAWGPLPEAAVKALGLKPGDYTHT